MLETLGKKLILYLEVPGVPLALRSLDLVTVAVALAVTGVLCLGAWWLRKGLPADPEAPLSRRGAFLIAALELAETQLLGGFPKKLARELLPIVLTLFLFVLLCNWVGVLPIPYIASPTQDINVTFSLALMVYALVHVYGARQRGLRRHLRSYLEPYPFLLPMNLIGDFGRTLSHAFRLFGNVLGGAILTTIVAVKFAPVLIPAGLNLWFGLFVGAIQALVFALLAAAYIHIAVE
jgi:F-type H+-transporting ATPase subunit a